MFLNGQFASFSDEHPLSSALMGSGFDPEFQNVLPQPSWPVQMQMPQGMSSQQRNQEAAATGKGAGQLFGFLKNAGLFGGGDGGAASAGAGSVGSVPANNTPSGFDTPSYSSGGSSINSSMMGASDGSGVGASQTAATGASEAGASGGAGAMGIGMIVEPIGAKMYDGVFGQGAAHDMSPKGFAKNRARLGVSDLIFGGDDNLMGQNTLANKFMGGGGGGPGAFGLTDMLGGGFT